MSESEPTCAVWYYRYQHLYVHLCDDEEEAARFAHNLYDYDSGAPHGIQYPDGRFVELGDWEAYQAENRRRHEEARADAGTPEPPPRTTELRPPFDDDRGRTASVEGDIPPWLGRRTR